MSHHFIHNIATYIALNNLNTQRILNNTRRSFNRNSIAEDDEDVSAEGQSPKGVPFWLIASIVGVLGTMALFAVVLIIVLFVFGHKESKALPEPDYSTVWDYNNKVVYGNVIDAALKQTEDGLFMLRDSLCNHEDTYIKILKYSTDSEAMVYRALSKSEFDSILSESSCLYLNEGIGVLDMISSEESEDISEELARISLSKKYVAKCIRESNGMIVGMYFEELK